ncbi:MAG: phage portal protein [Clostridia bacterium]|nr:phage portal protein [Clostridia bacterium]
MFTTITWQDYLASPDREGLLLEAIRRYKSSRTFTHALEANCYFRGENTRVARKTILRARKIETRDVQGRRRVRSGTEDVVGNRISSAFLFRFVTQQNQFLLSEGVSLPEDVKRRLGADFDHQLERLGECALLHGCAWGYWNADHLEVIEAAKNSWSGFFPLLDEMSGEARLGVQFWQLAVDRPLYLRVFEEDGVTVFLSHGKGLETVTAKQAYIRTLRRDALGETLCETPGYGRLPLIPLMANTDGLSELTPAIKAKIDAYDSILSDFADNLDRANDVYWVLNNFGGTLDDVAELLEEINRVKAVANLSDGTGGASTAEPHTIEVPYAARRAALDLLERSLYQDYMALDMDELTGSSLTNVAIRVSAANLNLKADRYEWQVRRFMSSLLSLLGISCDDIRFNRQSIANESETIADIAVMRPDIDQKTALRLNPYILNEEISALIHSTEAPQ